MVEAFRQRHAGRVLEADEDGTVYRYATRLVDAKAQATFGKASEDIRQMHTENRAEKPPALSESHVIIGSIGNSVGRRRICLYDRQ